MSRTTQRRKKKNTKQQNKKSMKQVLIDNSRPFFRQYKNDATRKTYESNFAKYIDFCRRKYNVKSEEECIDHIQDYVENLVKEKKTPSTIHSYIAPVCAYFQTPMNQIEKPSRKVSENVRSRNRPDKYKRSDQQFENEKYSLVANFQAKVGIRRNELKNLRLNNFKQDESGYWCVEVLRGKGGKYQLQRILPEDVDFIKNYFKTPDSTEKLFKESDFSKNMDLHRLRQLQSQQAYWYYYNQLHTGDYEKDSATAFKFRGELIKRWNLYNIDKHTGKPRHFPFEDTKGVYKLRGDNRRKALADGLPVEYDRLAVYMVSVFHLSHWRLDTLTNYLLAV